MTNTDRDTHFNSFASGEVDEVLEAIGMTGANMHLRKNLKTILAQRAYDLVEHTLAIVPQLTSNDNIKTMEQALSCIPDMLVLPEVKE